MRNWALSVFLSEFKVPKIGSGLETKPDNLKLLNAEKNLGAENMGDVSHRGKL